MNQIPVQVTRAFEFEAAHHLTNYVGPCERLHGHSYKLNVTVEGILDDRGMVVDFKDLKGLVKTEIIDQVDHQELNQVMNTEFSLVGNTTCENMIIAFWWKLDHVISETFENVKLAKLEMWETTNSHATLTREMVYGG